MTDYSNWKADHDIEGDFLGLGVSSVGGFFAGWSLLSVGGYLALGAGLGGAGLYSAIFILASHESDFYYGLWCNDSQFVALFTTAETYAKLLMMGCDCEQEAMDAYVELQVYILQKKYGDDWRKHARTSLLKYYDEMAKASILSSLSAIATTLFILPASPLTGLYVLQFILTIGST